MKIHVALPTLNEHPYLILPESVGWYWDDPEHTVERAENSWQTFSIHVIVSGKGYLEDGHQTHQLQRGDAFLYYPMRRQRYYSSREEPWSVRWIHFYGKELQTFLTERGF